MGKRKDAVSYEKDHKLKHMVISYDQDQDQWFHDMVRAKDADEAVKMVLAVRTYCVGAEALPLNDLANMAGKLAFQGPAQIEADWDDVVKDHEARKR